MQTLPCFSGEGRGWGAPSELLQGTGSPGVTHLFSLCCCSEHPMACPKTAPVSNFVKEVGREEGGGGEISLLFDFPGLCSLQ